MSFAADLAFDEVRAIPLSARYGDNVTGRTDHMGWYDGPTLLEHLETVDIARSGDAGPFRMPVQWVNRPNLDFRGFSGTVASGAVSRGDEIVVASSGRTSRVADIVTLDGSHERAGTGQAVTIQLADEIDISRGDVLAAAAARPAVSDQFAAHLIWMHDDALIPGRSYLIKAGTRTIGGSVTEIKHKVDVNTFQKLAAKTLQLNEVAAVNIATAEPIAYEPYADNRELGAFIVIDRLTDQTVGAGMIDFGLRRATNVHWQALDVTKSVRAAAKGQRPALVWFTGLSGAGKSTIANLVEKRLTAMGRHTYLLDGDNVRHGLNRDLGFTDADRVENIRRVAEAGKLMVDAGLIVLASFISPFRAERRMAREMLEPGEFVEVHVDTPLHVAEARDVKGLYKRARAGEIKNFTGIDSPYEPPEDPDLELAAGMTSAEVLAEEVVEYLQNNGYLD